MSASPVTRAGAALRREDGFTLVEVLVGALILVVGLVGTLAALDGGSHVSSVSQRQQRALSYAQQDIEALTARSWDELALDALPSQQPDATPSDAAPSTPTSYLTGCTGTPPANCTGLDVHETFGRRSSAEVSAAEPLVTPVAGGVDPTASLPGGTGTIYRYVTWAKDLPVDTASGAVSQQAKRVTVAVVLNGTAGQGVTKPVWSSTIVTDPGVTPLDLP